MANSNVTPFLAPNSEFQGRWNAELVSWPTSGASCKADPTFSLHFSSMISLLLLAKFSFLDTLFLRTMDLKQPVNYYNACLTRGVVSYCLYCAHECCIFIKTCYFWLCLRGRSVLVRGCDGAGGGTVCVARPRCYCCDSVLSIPCQIMSRRRTSSRCPQGNVPCHRLSVTLEGFFFLDAHGCR